MKKQSVIIEAPLLTICYMLQHVEVYNLWFLVFSPDFYEILVRLSAKKNCRLLIFSRRVFLFFRPFFFRLS